MKPQMNDVLKDNEAPRRVTIVTVCYNSSDVVTEMLASAPDATSVVLIDNASKDTEKLKELSDSCGAILIRNDKNKGFGVACNQGAALAKTEFILFLNPDARLMPDTLDFLVQAADSYPSGSAINPLFATMEGRSAFQRNSTRMGLTERMSRGWPAGDCEVPILSGAALFVRRATLETVGGFDPEIFLYHEDVSFRRLMVQCSPLYFIRNAFVRHMGGRSSARTPEVAALKSWHMGRSRVS
jgi:N-acetylglucosaminyl-diphospho-decaprenol L-rhamnosyltransferase